MRILKFYKSLLIVNFALLSCFCTDAESVEQKPFFADKIEVTPGGKLMLRPRLPYIEGLPDEEYNLVLDFPEAFTLSLLQVVSTDKNSKIASRSETVKEIVTNGKKRMELSCKPDLSQVFDGIDLQICHVNKEDTEYVPIIKFSGTFDWKSFRNEIRVSEDNISVTPLLLKWATNPTNVGTLFFRSLEIKEADSGKPVFSFHPKSPIIMKLRERQKDAFWFSADTTKTGEERSDLIKLISGKKYIVECQAKGEGIKSSFASTTKDALTKKVFYARTLIFDIALNLLLPDKLIWRIEDNDGKIYKRGELALVAPAERITPRIIDTSIWICETHLQKESLPIQKLYVKKFHAWGLNTIEPEMLAPAYDAPLTKESLSIPVALAAKSLGMRVRTYMHFLYNSNSSKNYLKANPQFALIDPLGRTPFGANVCPTHYLTEGNQWTKYYLDVIRKSVEINKLDGVFFDYEINAAPYIKSRPNKDGSRKWGNACVCERCRRAFMDYAKLDYVPSVEECCDKFYEKWVDFRCGQNIRFWQICSQAVKSANSNATFAIYSGFASKYSREGYGVDWTMAAPYLDFAMQRETCPIKKATVDRFSAALQKGMPEKQTLPKMLYQLQVFPYGDFWMYGGNENKAYAELSNMKNNVVRTVALCGSYGWSFCGIWGMDDQLTLPIREANAILAKYEDYFVKGKKVDNVVKIKTGNGEIATWRMDGKDITFVFNDTRQEKILTLVNGDKEAEVKIVPYDTAVYEW